MLWFFLFGLLGIYGSANAYLFWKVRAAFPGLGKFVWALAGFQAVMVFSPVLARYLDRWGHLRLAGAVSFLGYFWLPVVLWFVALAFAGDLWNLGVRVIALAAPGARAARLPARATVGTIGGLICLAMAWGVVEARSIRIHELTVLVPHLPAGMKELRIVQFSDLHLGEHIDQGRFERAVRLIRQANADVLVSTGDLVDASFHDVKELAGPLKELHVPLGKFAVLGNHEFYAGLGGSLAFHKVAGFRVLRGESVELLPGLRIAGVDDPAGRRTGQECFTDEAAALAAPSAADSAPGLSPQGDDPGTTIFLKHQPRVKDSSIGRFDLQLSGHAHGGQIFPWHAITATQFRFWRGLYALPGGSFIYASLGTGTWGPPIRLLARPEVTLIRLVEASVPAHRDRSPAPGPSAGTPADAESLRPPATQSEALPERTGRR